MEEDHNNRDDLVALFDLRNRRRPRALAMLLCFQVPTDVLSDRAFKSHYWFDKDLVRRLVGLLHLGRQDDRGRPIP